MTYRVTSQFPGRRSICRYEGDDFDAAELEFSTERSAAMVDGGLGNPVASVRLWDGAPLPAGARARVLRKFERWTFTHKQVLAIEKERRDRMKSIDPAEPRRLAARGQPYDPGGPTLTLDVSSLDPESAARFLLDSLSG